MKKLLPEFIGNVMSLSLYKERDKRVRCPSPSPLGEGMPAPARIAGGRAACPNWDRRAKQAGGEVKKLLLLFIISILHFSFFTLKAQNITTFAGNGDPGFGGDGDIYSSHYTKFYTPADVFIDSADNIFISDHGNNRIRKINTNGTLSTIAGNGTIGYGGDGGLATDASLNNPWGVTEDAVGNIYIDDQINNVIRKVSSSGIITTFAGIGAAGYSGDGGPASSAELHTPDDVTVDTKGNIYIADLNNNRIRKVDISGTITTIAGNGFGGYCGDGGQATDAELNGPVGVFIDKLGNVFISDFDNSRIRKVNTSGIISTIAGNGTQGYSGDGGLATTAELNTPVRAITDSIGNLYIDDAGNNVIREVINSSGIISTIAGNGTGGYSGDGGPATSAELFSPDGIALDKYGNVYIADFYNNRIREVVYSPEGIKNNENNMPFHVYPNPAINNLNFKLNGLNPLPVILSIMDLTGREVLSYSLAYAPNYLSIDISSLSSGMYFISITNKNEKFFFQKFIKL